MAQCSHTVPSWFRGRSLPGASQVLDVSLHACQALLTPPSPHSLTKATVSCWPPRPLTCRRLNLTTRSGDRNFGTERLQGGASPLRPTWFPVYASYPSFGSSCLPPFRLRRIRNTRYWRLVRPYQAGPLTPQETPSFAWRTTALAISGGAQRRPAESPLLCGSVPDALRFRRFSTLGCSQCRASLSADL